ncbi:hypothetical protein KDI_09370 [Dictyobacter arantiisoli]|uniref:Uncharacterized protein n=1 Tax=Dictyobacter arantiisoli TaxID=2014874 RepID=A0A5A5T8K4_9CHLR|nr:hypothetical protein KDI_09370 [Dictyobacter arantiisoli]
MGPDCPAPADAVLVDARDIPQASLSVAYMPVDSHCMLARDFDMVAALATVVDTTAAHWVLVDMAVAHLPEEVQAAWVPGAVVVDESCQELIFLAALVPVVDREEVHPQIHLADNNYLTSFILYFEFISYMMACRSSAVRKPRSHNERTGFKDLHSIQLMKILCTMLVYREYMLKKSYCLLHKDE